MNWAATGTQVDRNGRRGHGGHRRTHMHMYAHVWYPGLTTDARRPVPVLLCPRSRPLAPVVLSHARTRRVIAIASLRTQQRSIGTLFGTPPRRFREKGAQ